MSRKNTIIAVSSIILAFTLFMAVRLAVHSLRHGVWVSVEHNVSETQLLIPGNSGNLEDNKLQPGEHVNINAASVQELQRLPGIGSALAEEIYKYRRTHGAFINAEELKKVPGIGDKLYEEIKDYITVED